MTSRKKTPPVGDTEFWTKKSAPYLALLAKGPHTMYEIAAFCKQRRESEYFYDVLAYLSYNGKVTVAPFKEGRKLVSKWMVPSDDPTTDEELEAIDEEEADEFDSEDAPRRLVLPTGSGGMGWVAKWLAETPETDDGTDGDFWTSGPGSSPTTGEAWEPDPSEPDDGPSLEADGPSGGSGGGSEGATG